MRFARNGMNVRIAGIHMAVFRQAGRIAYYQIVANTHGIVGAYYYDFMVSGTESRTVFMDADDMAAGIVGMFALSPSAAETATAT